MHKLLRYFYFVLIVLASSEGTINAQDVGAKNINFQNGFEGWEMWEGKFEYDYVQADYFYSWTKQVTEQSERFKLQDRMVGSDDPIISCSNFLDNPFTDGSIPLRIGRPNLTRRCEGAESLRGTAAGAPGYASRDRYASAEKAEYSFIVTEETKALMVYFAAVLHDPNKGNTGDHIGKQIPEFTLNVDFYTPTGTKVPMSCSSFNSMANGAGSTLIRQGACKASAATNTSGQKVPTEYLYLPWTSAIYDLQGMEGYKVTITAMTHDCHVSWANGTGTRRDTVEVAGSHEAYGYIMAKTADLNLDVNYCESDNSNPTIKAPTGFYSYEWTVNGKPSAAIVPTNSDGNEIEIIKELLVDGATYECTIRGALETCSPIVLKTKLDPSKVIPDMEYKIGCNGIVEFTNKTTVEGQDPLSSYNWSFGDETASVRKDTIHKYEKEGVYTVTLRGTTKNGCSGEKDFQVIVPKYPTSVIMADDIVCKGEETLLSLYEMGNVASVQWMDSAKKVISTNNDMTVKLDNSAQFFTRVEDDKGCFYEDSVYILVAETPKLILKATKDTVCTGDSSIIRVSCTNVPSDKMSYAWSNGIGGNVNKVFPISTQKYFVTATNEEFGCITIADTTIVVRESIPVSIEGPTEICAGEQAVLKGKDAVTYNWIVEDESGNKVSYQGEELTLMPTKPKNQYEVEGIDKNQCRSRANHWLTVKESPKVEIAEAQDRVCPDQYASVRMLAATGYSFLWHDGSNGSSMRKKIAEDEDWSVVVSWNGCTDSLKIPVYVHEMPPVTISAAAEICSGDSAMVKVYAADEDNIEWLYPTDGRVVSKNTIMYAPNGNNINYQVSVTNADGCVGNANFEQKVLQPLGVQISAKPAVCYGDKLTLTAEGQGESFKWYMNDKYFDFKKVSDITIYEPAMMKVESIDKNGCVSYDSTKIDTLPRPVIDITGKMEVCKGQVAQIMASGADEYVWTVDGVQKSETSHLNLLMEKERATATVKATLQGCVSERKVFLTSIPDPIIRINGDGIICPGDKFTLTASGGETYKWSTGAETEEITTSATKETTYYVTGKDDKGCQATESYTVKVHKIPTIRIEQITKPGCQGEGDKVTLQAKGGIYYEWSATPEPEDMVDNAERIQVTIFNNTHFTVKGVDENGCSNTAEKEVVTVEAKKFQFDVSPKWVDESNPTVKLKGISPVEAEWTWRPHESADEHIGRTMTYTYNTREVADSVLISVEARDVNGCQYFGQYALYIWKDVWAPDAFTPNKDETNEKFRFLGGKHIDKFHYIIYNRLGEIMFEGNSLEDAWDGTWKGVEQPWGIYGWVCNYNCTFNGMEKSGEKRGFVTLIR